MTLAYKAGNLITGVSGDTKPTTVPTGSRFLETDTRTEYYFDGATWTGVTVDESALDIADLGGILDVVKGGTGAITLTGWLKGNGTGVVTSHTTSVVEVLDRAVLTVDYTDSSAENTIYSFSVPANTLSTNRMLRCTIICDYLNNSGGTKQLTLRIKYGGTTLYDDGTNTIAAAATRYPVMLTIYLAANNSTSAQQLGGWIGIGDTAGTTAGLGDFADDEIMTHTPITGASTENSTDALTFAVTIQSSAATATQSFKRYTAITELV